MLNKLEYTQNTTFAAIGVNIVGFLATALVGAIQSAGDGTADNTEKMVTETLLYLYKESPMGLIDLGLSVGSVAVAFGTDIYKGYQQKKADMLKAKQEMLRQQNTQQNKQRMLNDPDALANFAKQLSKQNQQRYSR